MTTKKKSPTIIEFQENPQALRDALAARMRAAHEFMGIEETGGIRFDDPAIEEIARLTRCSVGMGLWVANEAIDVALERDPSLPCIVTKEDIESLGFTFEQVQQVWTSGMHKIKTITVRKPQTK